ATVDIITKQRRGVVSVPISAIVIKTDTSSVRKHQTKKASDSEVDTPRITTEDKFECVFVKSNDEAKLRVVTTGIQDDSNIEILSGLQAGDVIITGPYNVVSKTLNPGDKIVV